MISAYAQECSLQGVKINWRNDVRECGIHCSGGQTYQICGDSCARTCQDISSRPDCRRQCVEGCNCPEGHALDEHGECVPIGQCGCQHEGMEFHAGYKEVRAASKAPEIWYMNLFCIFILDALQHHAQSSVENHQTHFLTFQNITCQLLF